MPNRTIVRHLRKFGEYDKAMTTTATYPDVNIPIPEHGMTVHACLRAAGFDAWFVGGYVRDALMDREAHDVDIATNAHWEQVQRACEGAGMRTYETGTKHGTLTVVPDEDHAIEVTTFRVDGPYLDGRHPEQVSFARTIEEDLRRRDFTMNALAYQPGFGILDPTGGVADIRAKIIRVVGDAELRFKEDALRILRGCRFVSELGFTLESQTHAAMQHDKSLLENVSRERTVYELDRLLLGEHAHDAIMDTWDVLAYLIPELVAMQSFEQLTKYHCYDVLEHTAWAVQFAQPTRLVRWAAFCHDMGKPACAFFDDAGVEHFYGHAHVSAYLAHGLLHRMGLSPAFAKEVCTLVRHHSSTVQSSRKSVRKVLAKLDGDPEMLRALLALKRADMLAHAPEYAQNAAFYDEVEAVLDEVLAANDAFTVRMLAVNGCDLMAVGIPKGPEVGRVLSWLLSQVLEECIPNEKTALLRAVTDRRR